MRHQHLFAWLGPLLLAATLCALPGCQRGSGRADVGTVWGKVLFKDEPLPGGTIHFIHSKTTKTSLWIRSDGGYSGEIPAGPAKVAIETDSVKYTDRDTMFKKWRERKPDLAGKKQKALDLPVDLPRLVYTPIPARYSDPNQSGLTCEIVEGAQRHDFTLE
jgi:hypothetical protein